jgi:hypothetical protein
MKSTLTTLLAVIFCTATIEDLFAQAFNSGSDGSYGALNVTVTTNIQVPPNGIFNCTTINVAANQTLRFIKNANNTPVYLLATGNVTISGTINVSGGQGNSSVGGEGGPGGFSGGNPGSLSLPAGAGYGPGAGRGGANDNLVGGAGGGSYATIGANTASTNRGAAYGSALLVPIVGGSGGGGTDGTPGNGGGGGGGAILVASSTRIDCSGSILANGGRRIGNAYNSGSGGAIRLVAPVVAVTGTGLIRARGADTTFEGGGEGRIRVDTLNRASIAFPSFDPPGSTSVGSMMLVFPTPAPRLDITEAAGTAIPLNSGPVFVLLPFGSATNRTIKVRAQDFGGVVPINVVLTPDNGTPVIYPAQIDNGAANPAEVTVNVVVPVNVQTSVNAWTR